MSRSVGLPTTQKSIRVPEDILDQLNGLSRKHDRPVAWLMRRFILYVLADNMRTMDAIDFIPVEDQEGQGE